MKCKRCGFKFFTAILPSWGREGFCSINCRKRYAVEEELKEKILPSEPHQAMEEEKEIVESPLSQCQPVSLYDIQLLHARWTFKNSDRKLGPERCLQPLAGVTEEVGELAHSILKLAQGISKNKDHYAKGQYAVGDIVMYLLDTCTRMGWSFNDCVSMAWEEIEQKDWIKERSTNE